MNDVTICGNLGADPKFAKTGKGTSVANLSVCTNEYWIDEQGVKHETKEWHHCVAWGRAADNAAQYLKKGREVLIKGKLKTRSYEKVVAGVAVKMYVTEIHVSSIKYLGGGRKDQDADTASRPAQSARTQAARPAADPVTQEFFPDLVPAPQDMPQGDDLPF